MRLFHCSFSPVKEMLISFFTRHTSIVELEVSSIFQPGLEIRMHPTCKFANARKSTIVHPVHPIFCQTLASCAQLPPAVCQTMRCSQNTLALVALLAGSSDGTDLFANAGNASSLLKGASNPVPPADAALIAIYIYTYNYIYMYQLYIKAPLAPLDLLRLGRMWIQYMVLSPE